MIENNLSLIIAVNITILTILISLLFILTTILLLNLIFITKKFKKILENFHILSNDILNISNIPKTLILKLTDLISVYIDKIIEKNNKGTNDKNNEN